MENQFVTYKIGEELRNLGFNDTCFAMFQKNKKLWFCKKNDWLFNFQINPDPDTLKLHIQEFPDNIHTLSTGEQLLIESTNFTAPLWQQVINWFRIKYDVEIVINRFYFNDSSRDCFFYIVTDLKDRENDYVHHLGDSFTFEQAREQAILYTIKYINGKLRKST